MDQLSDSYTKVSRSAINLKIAIIIRFCMADELNGQTLPVHHTNQVCVSHVAVAASEDINLIAGVLV